MAAIDQAAPNPAPGFRAERARTRQRRQGLGIARPGPAGNAWGLALSGGGIRSATFCLGVLQGLARTAGPSATGPRSELLHQFDYLSTVSGGGYIGSFLSSLYVPARLNGDPGDGEGDAVERVGHVLRDEPPERMHHGTAYQPERPGKAALAWLRDNGRYLAPSGAGDYLYAVGMAVRNWLALHYVVGTVVCLMAAMVLLGRWALLTCPWLALHEQALLDAARAGGLWWSSLWWLCVPLLLAWPLPAGIAFWFSHTERNLLPSEPPPGFTVAEGFGLAAGLVFAGLAARLYEPDRWFGRPAAALCAAAAAATLLAGAWHALSWWHARKANVIRQRVLLTRWLAAGLAATLGVALAAAVETFAQTAFLSLDRWSQWLGSGSLLGAVVWLARWAVAERNEKKLTGWLAALPLDALAAAGGAALWIVIAAAWQVLVLALFWNGEAPDYTPAGAGWPGWALARAGLLTAVFLVLVWVTGQFPGFLNLSTLQSLYSARLTRAYLGASNFRRFGPAASAKARSAAEPIEGDGLTVEEVYRNRLAPVHLVNVCLNQTVDPAEQLIQRDRKGKPLVVAPGGYYLDGQPHAFRPPGQPVDRTEVAVPLGFGDWIGVSGAAFTTGLGRTTSLGMSLLLGFANIRLGRWWPSGVDDRSDVDKAEGRLRRRFFKTQAYLFDELTARFHGTKRQYQYLSDGGHFENTGVYELLRPRRRVKLIVVCDCGCDPDHGFDDLANLARLARIDHRLEVTVNQAAADDPVLGRTFGRPADLAKPPSPGDNRCALLLDVCCPGKANKPPRLVARIVVLKPRLIDAAPLDVVNYQRLNPAFPQEPTGDQFYAEAQWESYRKLGLAIALQVFPGNAEDGQVFWNQVLARL